MTTEAKVGIFVLASLALLAYTLIHLVNAEFRGGGVPYRTYLSYAGGLEAGNDVLFAGITAGKVMAVQALGEGSDAYRDSFATQKGNTCEREVRSEARLHQLDERPGPDD